MHSKVKSSNFAISTRVLRFAASQSFFLAYLSGKNMLFVATKCMFTYFCHRTTNNEVRKPAWPKHWHAGLMRPISFCAARKRFLLAVYRTKS